MCKERLVDLNLTRRRRCAKTRRCTSIVISIVQHLRQVDWLSALKGRVVAQQHFAEIDHYEGGIFVLKVVGNKKLGCAQVQHHVPDLSIKRATLQHLVDVLCELLLGSLFCSLETVEGGTSDCVGEVTRAVAVGGNLEELRHNLDDVGVEHNIERL